LYYSRSVFGDDVMWPRLFSVTGDRVELASVKHVRSYLPRGRDFYLVCEWSHDLEDVEGAESQGL
jgi:hypothetical protein